MVIRTQIGFQLVRPQVPAFSGTEQQREEAKGIVAAVTSTVRSNGSVIVSVGGSVEGVEIAIS